MDLEFKPLVLPNESERLAELLSSEEWPFHSDSKVSRDRIFELINKGYYSGPNHATFWILDSAQDQRIGFIRLFDLEDIGDGSPLFDLRILSSYRGKGIGKKAVLWLTNFLFEKWPELNRIEGTTRVDNLAMRAIFKKCGYVKEGHYRQAWPTQDGRKLDAVQYTILREDWLSGSPTLVPWND